HITERRWLSWCDLRSAVFLSTGLRILCGCRAQGHRARHIEQLLQSCDERHLRQDHARRLRHLVWLELKWVWAQSQLLSHRTSRRGTRPTPQRYPCVSREEVQISAGAHTM